MAHQIKTNLHAQQGKAITNSERILTAPQSDLAQQVLKDPFNFDVRHKTRYGIPGSVKGYSEGCTQVNQPLAVSSAISLPQTEDDEIALRYNGTRPTPERKTPDVSADSALRQNGTRSTSISRQDTENTTKNTQRVQQQLVAPQAMTKPKPEGVVAFAAALTQDLIALGVKPKVAQSLVKAYPHAAIR